MANVFAMAVWGGILGIATAIFNKRQKEHADKCIAEMERKYIHAK